MARAPRAPSRRTVRRAVPAGEASASNSSITDALDADDVMEQMAEAAYAAALAEGRMTEAQVAHARRLRKLKDEVSMCRVMEKMELPPAEAEAAALQACAGGHLATAQWLASLLPASELEKADEGGLTPLHYASEAGHADVVEWLLAQGVRPTKTIARTAQHEGHTDVVKMLKKALKKVGAGEGGSGAGGSSAAGP